MIKLVWPSNEYLNSYKEALVEYEKKRTNNYSFFDVSDDMFTIFDDYRNDRNLKPGYVGAHYFWLVDDIEKKFIGEISIRHSLTDSLLKYGGNIGYGVRFSEWKKGYGTMMLKFALEKAKELELDKVLITCDDDNYGSAKVIENNGGILENKIKNVIDGKEITTRRYWIYLK